MATCLVPVYDEQLDQLTRFGHDLANAINAVALQARLLERHVVELRGDEPMVNRVRSLRGDIERLVALQAALHALVRACAG